MSRLGRKDLKPDAIQLVTVKAGVAQVVHTASGRILGTVERDGDQRPVEWRTRLGDGTDLGYHDDTRVLAAENLLDAFAHHPGTCRLERGSGRRDLTEEEHRRACPEDWAWWDKVESLFPKEKP